MSKLVRKELDDEATRRGEEREKIRIAKQAVEESRCGHMKPAAPDDVLVFSAENIRTGVTMPRNGLKEAHEAELETGAQVFGLLPTSHPSFLSPTISSYLVVHAKSSSSNVTTAVPHDVVQDLRKENQRLRVEMNALFEGLGGNYKEMQALSSIQSPVFAHGVCDGCLQSTNCFSCQFCGGEAYCSAACQLSRRLHHEALCLAKQV